MDQQSINDEEWHRPENWSGSVFGVYFSKRDTRIWVPKSVRALGWTLNLGHPAGVRWLFAILLFPFFIVLGALLAVLACGR